MGAGKNKKHASYSVSPTTKHHPAAPATAATAGGATSVAPVPQPSSSEPAGVPSPGTAAAVAGVPAQQVAAVADTEDHAQAANSGLEDPTWPHELPSTAKKQELSADGPESAGETPKLAAGVDASEGPGPGSIESEGTPDSQGADADAGAPKVDWADAAYPVPDTPAPGEVMGTPVLIGGADLEGSSATLRSYLGPAGPREVLMATVNQDAEAKLLEAVA